MSSRSRDIHILVLCTKLCLQRPRVKPRLPRGGSGRSPKLSVCWQSSVLHMGAFPTSHTSPVLADPAAPGFGSRGSARASYQPASCASCCPGPCFSSGFRCTECSHCRQAPTDCTVIMCLGTLGLGGETEEPGSCVVVSLPCSFE